MKKMLYYALMIVTITIILILCPDIIYAKENVSVHSQETSPAKELTISLICDHISSLSNLLDQSYQSKITFSKDDVLTISCSEDIDGIYIIWDNPCHKCTLNCKDQQLIIGNDGYLHEYCKLPVISQQCSITFSDTESISEIHAYSAGSLPDYVEVWQSLDSPADILVFSTHADDEILFLGGILATYAGQEKLNVQVVYLTNYWNGATIREHEKLDGIWTCGVNAYPVNGDFDDLYCSDLDQAMNNYNYSEILDFVMKQIRIYKPLICVTQDFNGEYGHGGHQILAKAVSEACQKSMDSSICPESARQYGIWNIPKTYFHLYNENSIHLDLSKPLDKMNNKTALDIAKEAYKKHVSQQWCWFYVSDNYEYSCADFGLFRSTVGNDTGNDLLENLTTYKMQKLENELKERCILVSTSLVDTVEENIYLANEIQKKNKARQNKLLIKTTILICLVIFLFLFVVTIKKHHLLFQYKLSTIIHKLKLILKS